MKREIKVGSRKSLLAMTQTKWVIRELEERHPELIFTIVPIITKGDQIIDVTLSKVGGKGLFVKELEEALFQKEIDFAVHSMKDMPAKMADAFTIAAVPKRVDARDALISRTGHTLAELSEGAKIGTSSLRREHQLQRLRPNIDIQSIRGNIDTRIKKCQAGEFDAILLAAAGLIRMGWEDKITQYLSLEESLPAVGQGALGIQARQEDHEVLTILESINDQETAEAVRAERAFLERLNGGCQVPIGAYCFRAEGSLVMQGMVASQDGQIFLKEELRGSEPEKLGLVLAEILLERGAKDFL
jgi:hydroxymethylbilane synthase